MGNRPEGWTLVAAVLVATAAVVALAAPALAGTRPSWVSVTTSGEYLAGHVEVNISAGPTDPPATTVDGTIELHDSRRSYGTFPYHYEPGGVSSRTVDLGAFVAGTYTLTATYSGDGNLAPSSTTVTFKVLKRSSAARIEGDRGRGPYHCPPGGGTSIGCPPENVPAGTTLTFQAFVADVESHPQNSPPLPTGTVAFLDNGNQITTRPLGAYSRAEWKVVLSPGRHYITPSYFGDQSYNPTSNSQGWSVVVDGGGGPGAPAPSGGAAPPAGGSRSNTAPRTGSAPSAAAASASSESTPTGPGGVAGTTGQSSDPGQPAAGGPSDDDSRGTVASGIGGGTVGVTQEPADGGSWPVAVAGAAALTGTAGTAALIVLRRRRASVQLLHSVVSKI